MIPTGVVVPGGVAATSSSPVVWPKPRHPSHTISLCRR
jgi:hypothetical protein